MLSGVVEWLGTVGRGARRGADWLERGWADRLGRRDMLIGLGSGDGGVKG